MGGGGGDFFFPPPNHIIFTYIYDIKVEIKHLNFIIKEESDKNREDILIKKHVSLLR